MGKIVSVAILLAVLIFTINSYQFNADTVRGSTSADSDINVHQPEMRVLNPLTHEFEDVESLLTETTVPFVKNESVARFQASISNSGTISLQLKSFRVSMFNETGLVTNFEKYYPSEILVQEILAPRQLKTETVDGVLAFHYLEMNYHFQLTFVYVLQSNTSSILETHSTENITISVLMPEPGHPVLILWGISLFIGILVFMCALGYYGDRRKKQLVEEAVKG